MSISLCNNKCYIEYPGKVDPYRWPCADGTKCIPRTSMCDAKKDCPDNSDEQVDCPWYVKLNLVYTLLICLAALLQSVILHFLFSTWSQSLSKLNQSIPVQSPTSPTSAFLLHPALSDLEGRHWSWQHVGKELRIEMIFFNRDSQYLLSLLSVIEDQDAHPDNVHRVFIGFFAYLETEGYTRDAVAFSMRQSIGHNKLAHMVLKGPPNLLDRKVYQLKKWMTDFENRNKVGFVCFSILRTLTSYVSPFLMFLDNVKDLALNLILRGTVQRQESACPELSDLGSCLAASQAEKNLLDALLATLSLSMVSTSLHAYHQRYHFFVTNRLFDIILFLSSPFLPAVYHMQVAKISQSLEQEKKNITNLEYRSRKQKIAKLRDIIHQSKSIEVGLEAITQILLLSCLATFFFFVFKGPSGQTYSYFYGVAELVLKGNAQLFLASIFISFMGPCIFYLNSENQKKRESFNMPRKLLLFLRNVFFLMARLGVIISALFIPVISQWDFFVANSGLDASTHLDDKDFEFEFSRHFGNGLQSVSDDVGTNLLYFTGFVFFHLYAVASYTVLCSPKFGSTRMTERWLHLLTTFWLPLPYLTLEGVDRGEEKSEQWFLIALYTCENLALLIGSRWAYLPDYPPGLMVLLVGMMV